MASEKLFFIRSIETEDDLSAMARAMRVAGLVEFEGHGFRLRLSPLALVEPAATPAPTAAAEAKPEPSELDDLLYSVTSD